VFRISIWRAKPTKAPPWQDWLIVVPCSTSS